MKQARNIQKNKFDKKSLVLKDPFKIGGEKNRDRKTQKRINGTSRKRENKTQGYSKEILLFKLVPPENIF
jgi:hypothetical protein